MYFRVASFPGYGKLSNRPLEEMQPGRGRRRRRAEGEPAGLRAVEGAQGGRGHRLAGALGRGPAGLAHRVLGDGGAAPGHRLRDPRRRLGPGVPPPRERDRPDRGRPRRAAGARSGCTTAWCSSATRRWPSRWATSACCTTALDEFGRDALIMYFVSGHYRQPIAFSAEALEEAQRGGRPRCASCAGGSTPAAPGPRASTATPSASSTAWPTTSTPRPRAPCCSSGSRRPTGAWTPGETVGAGRAGRDAARRWGWRTCSRTTRRGPRRRRRAAAGRARARRAPTRDFAPRRRAARRAGRRGLGGARHARGRAARAPGDRLRAQPGARGAARRGGPSSASGPPRRRRRRGLAGRGAELHAAGGRRDRGALRLADHQGVCAEAGAYPYADADRAAERRGRAGRRAWTRCRTRTTSAPSAAWPSPPAPPGVVIPERRSAEVTPAVCKASAGAVEHLPVARVRNLADWLGAAKEAAPGSTARRPGARPCPTTEPDYRGRVVLVLGSEGRGLRPRVAAACDQMVPLPQRGRVGSLNVSHRGGGSRVRDLAIPQIGT